MPRTPAKPRLKDIAKLANISIATASMALADHPNINDQTKQRVREIGKKLGYRTLTRAASDGQQRFGLMIVGGLGQDAVNVPLMLHLSQAGFERNVRFEYTATPRELDEFELLKRVTQFARELDGVVLVGLVTPWLIGELQRANVVCMVLGDMLGDLARQCEVPVVTVDKLAMGYMATRLMLKRGHRRVAFVCEELLPGLSHDRWYKGYCFAHIEMDVPMDRALACIAGESEIGAGPAVETLLAMKSPATAYVVPDTRIASSLVAEMLGRGRTIAQDALVFEAIAAEQSLPDNLRGRPRLVGDIDQLAMQCIHQLQQACKQPGKQAVRVLTPFQTYDFPDS